jgi:hypothetical protein
MNVIKEFRDCSRNNESIAKELRRHSVRRRFEFESVNLDRDASHERVKREHYSKLVLKSEQYAFHPTHRPRFDTDSLANDQVRMRFDCALPKTGAQRLDFKIGEGREASSKTHQRQYPGHFEHSCTFPGIDMYKYVVRKKR